MADMQYVVSTVFKADDKMSPAVRNMGLQANTFASRLTRSFTKAKKSALGLRTVMGGILGASAITRGLGLLRQGVAGLASEYIDFDQAITNAGAKWGIKRGTEQFRELGKVARDVAAVTPYSAGEAGAGLDYLAMAGFEAGQAMAALPGVTQLAIASNTDLAEASDIASDALSSLGLMTKNSTQLTENLNRVNDVFAKTTITSNTNLQMLFESMKMVAPVATGLGGDVEELSAMIGTLANAGIKATMSGTSLRNMYLRLTGGTKEVTKVLRKYRIEITDSHGKMRSMIDILDDIRKKTEKLDDETKQAAYTHLFGARAIASATVLMKEGGVALHRYERMLRNSRGAAKDLADEMGKSLGNRLKALRSRFIELGIKGIEVFEKDIFEAMDKVGRWLDEFDGEKFKRWVKTTYEEVKPLARGLHDVTKEAASIISWFHSNNITLVDITKAFIAWKVAVAGLNVALGITKGNLGGILALKGLPALLKLAGGGSAAVGGAVVGGAAVGVVGAAYVGSKAVKEQKESYDRFAEMWRKEKERREDKKWEGKILSRQALEEYKDIYQGDATLAELAYQRAQETGMKKWRSLPLAPEYSSVRAPKIIEVPKMPEPPPQKVNIEVDFSNLPEGAKTKVTTAGPTISKPIINTSNLGVQ